MLKKDLSEQYIALFYEILLLAYAILINEKGSARYDNKIFDCLLKLEFADPKHTLTKYCDEIRELQSLKKK